MTSFWVVDVPVELSSAGTHSLQAMLSANADDVELALCRFGYMLPGRAGSRLVFALQGKDSKLKLQGTRLIAAKVPSWQVGLCCPALRTKAEREHTPRDFYSCAHCKKRGAEMMICSACYLEAFCSKECQKAGWPQHEGYCAKRRMDIAEWKISKDDLKGLTIADWVGTDV